MGQFMYGKTAVANKDYLPPWQPAAELQGTLPGPIGQEFVTTPTLKVGSL